jgi:microcompartment protein CcmK/EutM
VRLGTVIGTVTLGKIAGAFPGARWLVVSPLAREQFQSGANAPAVSKEPSLVVFDNLGAAAGQTIGFIEGREAAMPFDQPAPIDAIAAALVDNIFYSPFQ